MKTKKIIRITIVLVLLFGLFGCEAKSSKNDINKQPATNKTPSSQPAQAGEPPQTSDNQSKNSQQTTDIPLQTEQEVLSKIGAVLKTKVPIMLPTNVPIENGNYLTATTISQDWYYKVNFYESSGPADIDSQTASKGNLIATVEGTEYKDAASAKGAINGYALVDPSKYPDMEIDLGHNIKAIGEGGLGHGYLTWNEGRWCIRLDGPNDPAYKNKQYPDSKKLAESVVEYLDKNMLPAPQKIGVISINNWNNSHGTTIQWQNNQMVYQVLSQDPMTALKVAVAMKPIMK